MNPKPEFRIAPPRTLIRQFCRFWILVLCSLPAAQAVLAAEVTPSARVESFVSVRSAPENGELLATLPVGQTAELLATLPAHYQVRLADGTTGFVLRSYTSVIETPGAAAVRAGELALQAVSELIVVDSMHARKQIMFDRSDAIAVLPGGIGTLEETVEMITWMQLGLHRKDIVMIDPNGYWAPLQELMRHMIDAGFAGPELADYVTVVSSPGAALEALGVPE